MRKNKEVKKRIKKKVPDQLSKLGLKNIFEANVGFRITKNNLVYPFDLAVYKIKSKNKTKFRKNNLKKSKNKHKIEV